MHGIEYDGAEYFAEPINGDVAVTEVHGDGTGWFVDPILAAEIVEVGLKSVSTSTISAIRLDRHGSVPQGTARPGGVRQASTNSNGE